MNKLVILVLFAFVASALAGPAKRDYENSLLVETEDKETAGLDDYKQFFSDFCIYTRKAIAYSLSTIRDSGTERAIELMLEAVAEIRNGFKDAEMKAVNESPTINEDAWQFKKSFNRVGADKIHSTVLALADKVAKEQLAQSVNNLCDWSSRHMEAHLEDELVDYKSRRHGLKAEKFTTVSLENLGCVTASRVSKIAYACRNLRWRKSEVFFPEFSDKF